MTVSIDDVRRVNFGYFVRPPEETGTGQPRIEPVLGYLVRVSDRFLLFDTGIGGGYGDLDAHYRPVRRSLPDALAALGTRLDNIAWATNCHLHFDHCGGNPLIGRRPVFVQDSELSVARSRQDYTLPELVAEDVAYEPVHGEVELFPGVHLVPTPGHVDGHQSLVVRCGDGTVICAGQSHDVASELASDMMAHRAVEDGLEAPLPTYPRWIANLARFDPARIMFAHDCSVWLPA